MSELQKPTIILNGELLQSIDKTWELILENESIYYSDILILCALCNNLEESIKERDIFELDAKEVYSYLNQRYIITQKNMQIEKQLVYSESHIKDLLDSIESHCSNLDFEKTVKVFKELFSKIHSKTLKEFNSIVDLEYNPLYQSYEEFENKKFFLLISLKDKIRSERKLIQEGILKADILEDRNVQKIIELLKKGHAKESLQIFEEILTRKLSDTIEKDNSTTCPNVLRKIYKLNFQINELEKNSENRIVSKKKRLIEIELILINFFDLLEEIYTTGLDTWLIEGERKKKPVSKRKIVNDLIKNGKTNDAIELLSEIAKNNNEVLKDLTILQSRYNRNKENQMRGLRYDKEEYN